MKLREIFANRLLLIGSVLTSIFLLGIIVGPWLSPYSPTDSDFMAILAPPSLEHPLGTDSFGRDVLTRVLHGAGVSLMISAVGVLTAAALGVAAGLVAAHYGGWRSMLLTRFSDLLFSFPSFVLALFLMVILGYGTANIAIAIALIYLPIFMRLTRNLALVVRSEPWVEAAAVMGQSSRSIMLREILPNIAAPIYVQFAIGVAFGIVIEAGLSFLGLGVQPPAPSLGTIMADGREYFQRAPWVLTMSGIAISAALLGLNLLSDGIRDIVDPRLKGRL